ncbi:MAG TPA: outer membrane beta-barrel protein [Candidatus Angelobacter sp.]
MPAPVVASASQPTSALSSAVSGPHAQLRGFALTVALLLFAGVELQAQTAPAASDPASAETSELRELREAVRELQVQVAELKRELHGQRTTDARPVSTAAPAAGTASAAPVQAAAGQDNAAAQAKPDGAEQALDFLRRTTIEVGIDTYYGFNFNDPIGRVNLLRAYDVSSNAFSLNQANVILKQDPDPAAGRRFGARLDLQFGQATETLQGNAANEPRPDVYRNVFQAYGTYVFPAGSGLTLDVGKFASSLGYETNYSKDQFNYSRSYWFDFLPFYHMGARVNYKVNDAVALNYWLVNGTQQTEAFNGFKDQFFGVTLTPTKTINWNVNYYLGQEHPDVVFFPNGGAPPNSPTFQGLPFQPIPNAPNGRLHIFDTYITWLSTPKLTFVLEGDYVIERLFKESAPSTVWGGAGYVQYRFTPKDALAARGEYLGDQGGLYSGKTEALKEITVTYGHKLVSGFLVQTEFRRDFSNQPVFLTDTLGALSKHQNTATVGLIWWWGNKNTETW